MQTAMRCTILHDPMSAPAHLHSLRQCVFLPKYVLLPVGRHNKLAGSRCRASALEEIDPYTGEVISGTALAKTASSSVNTAGGLSWAYRTADVDQEAGTTTAGTPVVMLHGLGSSSYGYRNLVAPLTSAGFQAIAPDWIGHGNSDKVRNNARPDSV